MTRALLAATALLSLVGCAETEELKRIAGVAPQGTAPATPTVAGEPTPAERAAQALKSQPAADPTVATLVPRVGPEPGQLAGMVPAQLTELLGDPKLRRREGEAEIWMYSSRLCILHLFLYPANLGGLGVKHYEMRRPSSSTPVAPRDCLDSLSRQGAKPKPS